MDLSLVYREAPYFYVVTYETGDGSVELVDQTFVNEDRAWDWVEENYTEFLWCDEEGNPCTEFNVRRARLMKLNGNMNVVEE